MKFDVIQVVNGGEERQLMALLHGPLQFSQALTLVALCSPNPQVKH
jgi:hypothetical protein